MTDELRAAAETAAADVAAVADPVERFRAARRLRVALDVDAELTAAQRSAVLELRRPPAEGARPRSFQVIADMIGDITKQRVEQIAKGRRA